MPPATPQGVKDQLIHLARKGYGPYAAAAEVGIAASTLHQMIREDAEFGKAWREAKQVALDRVEATLVEMAVDGNLAAAKFVLTNRRPRRWREVDSRSTALPGSNGPQVTINVAQVARDLATDPNKATRALEIINSLPPKALPGPSAPVHAQAQAQVQPHDSEEAA